MHIIDHIHAILKKYEDVAKSSFNQSRANSLNSKLRKKRRELMHVIKLLTDSLLAFIFYVMSVVVVRTRSFYTSYTPYHCLIFSTLYKIVEFWFMFLGIRIMEGSIQSRAFPCFTCGTSKETEEEQSMNYDSNLLRIRSTRKNISQISENHDDIEKNSTVTQISAEDTAFAATANRDVVRMEGKNNNNVNNIVGKQNEKQNAGNEKINETFFADDNISVKVIENPLYKT
eukprot:g4478.t1